MRELTEGLNMAGASLKRDQARPADRPPRTAIVVIGMHRSGTSLVTRVFSLLGANLPSDLLPPTEHNSEGYWESSGLISVHDEMLSALGSSWHDMGPLPAFWENENFIRPYRAKIVEALSTSFGDAGFFVVKDPRISRFVPLINSSLTELGAVPKFVIAVRNPLEVSASLKARDQFSFCKSLLLWLDHTLCAERATRGFDRMFVLYDDVLVDWRNVANSAAMQLGISFPSWSAHNDAEIETLIKPTMRHHAYKAEDISMRADVAEWVEATFQAVRSLSHCEHNDKATQDLDRVHEEFTRAQRAFGPLVAQANRVKDVQTRLDETEAEAAKLRTELQKKESALSALELATRARDEEVSAHKASHESALRALESATKALDDHRAEAADLRHKLYRQVTQFAKETSEFNATLQAREASLAARNNETSQLNNLLQDRSAQVTQYEVELRRDRARLSELRSQLNSLHASRSWRLTAPFRTISRGISWSIRNTRRVLTLGWWLLTGQLSRAAQASLPYYRRYVPLRVRSMIPDSLRRMLRRRKLVGATSTGRPKTPLKDPASDLNVPAAEEPASRDSESAVSPGNADAIACAYRQYWEQANLSKDAGVYREMAETAVKPEECDVKFIAYYLPQFHPITENDTWWGRGFTEWRNVAKAAPVFPGHYQPKLPGELGFYDLRIADVIRRQAELARLHGISAFCFHFYWFGGERLLEKPLSLLLENRDIDIEFCLCWANENWTRRWDGFDQEILIGQSHSPEDDIAFIRYLKRYFDDPRYLKVDGKPVLTVYRPGILPDAAATAARWRAEAEAMGLPGLYLVATNSFGFSGAQTIGFDALSEFPPHSVGLEPQKVEPLTDEFTGQVYRYEDCMRAYKEANSNEKCLWPGAMPNWDNTARRPATGTVYHGSTPALFREWLDDCVEKARRNPVGERYVVINAWNEWAEGAYLEPDQRLGFAWLWAVRNAIVHARRQTAPRSIILVSHDAHLYGAQLLSLGLVRSLAADFHFAVDVVLLGSGPLKSRFEEFATVHDLSGADPQGAEAKALAEQLFASGHRLALVNSTASGCFLETLTRAGVRCTAIVHEMPLLIAERQLEDAATAIAKNAQTIIFSADAVEESFRRIVNIGPHHDAYVIPQGLCRRNELVGDLQSARQLLREQLGISPDKKIALGVGSADLRKGVDLFVEAGLKLAEERSDIDFVWLGSWEMTAQALVSRILANKPNSSRFHFLEFQKDTDFFYAGSDIFVLSSREDPLPTAALMAIEAGLPIAAFANSGGIPDLIKDTCGSVVPWSDADALAGAIAQLEKGSIGAIAGKKLVEKKFSFREYVFDLLNSSGVELERVSVIVPNYNYAPYLRERLSSIAGQSYPVFELIVLDDGSTDESLEVIEEFRRNSGCELQVDVNPENSGSVFAQWKKGLSLARGNYIWIAEADDIADPNFLSSVVSVAALSNAALTFTDSFQIDEGGDRIGDSYAAYCDGSGGRFSRDFVLQGRVFLRECLSIKNTVLNVSSVLWRRDALQRAIDAVGDTIESYKVAGDWRLYAEAALADEPIAYVAQSLNGHRRHLTSVTRELDKQRHLQEIMKVHDLIADVLNADEALTAEMKAHQRKVAEQFDLHHLCE